VPHHLASFSSEILLPSNLMLRTKGYGKLQNDWQTAPLYFWQLRRLLRNNGFGSATHRRPPATRIWGGSCTGWSTLKSCPVQSEPLACTGSVAVIARASTDPTITLIFDFMGITSFLRWKIASRSACGCDGHHRKDDRAMGR
jgi:hypothetical protein